MTGYADYPSSTRAPALQLEVLGDWASAARDVGGPVRLIRRGTLTSQGLAELEAALALAADDWDPPYDPDPGNRLAFESFTLIADLAVTGVFTDRPPPDELRATRSFSIEVAEAILDCEESPLVVADETDCPAIRSATRP